MKMEAIPRKITMINTFSLLFHINLHLLLNMYHHYLFNRRQLIICKAINEASFSPPILCKRSLCIIISSIHVLTLASKGCFDANVAILEKDNDKEQLEKVKRDREQRIERWVLKSSTKKTCMLISLNYLVIDFFFNGKVCFVFSNFKSMCIHR